MLFFGVVTPITSNRTIEHESTVEAHACGATNPRGRAGRLSPRGPPSASGRRKCEQVRRTGYLGTALFPISAVREVVIVSLKRLGVGIAVALVLSSPAYRTLADERTD